MEINRRSAFLGLGSVILSLSTNALAAIPKHTPVIYGDDVHDDAPGLQAMIDGRPVVVKPDSGVTIFPDKSFYVDNGSFLLKSGIKSNEGPAGQIYHSKFTQAKNFSGDCLLDMRPERKNDFVVQNCYFIGNQYKPVNTAILSKFSI